MSSLEDIGQLINGDLQKVRGVIEGSIRRQPREIRESLGCYFASSGKLLRPMLTCLSARAATGGALGMVPERETMMFAAAVELVHNASLVHDDIMDGDTIRRNMPTLHAKYGATSAVLLGDVLHITVFNLLGRIDSRAAVGLMTRTIRNMCYGQLLDTQTKTHSAAEYAKIIRGKTGSLMAAACAGGAVLSGAGFSGLGIRRIARFGMHAGMLYQMVDDYRDGDGGIALDAAAIEQAAGKSKTYLQGLSGSPYRSKLIDFVDYIVSMAQQTKEEAYG